MTLRHLLGWKTLFYNGLLPSLRACSPARGDVILGAAGRYVANAWPSRRRELAEALHRTSLRVGAGWDVDRLLPLFQGNVLRFLARDCQLDGSNESEFLDRFDVSGFEHLRAALEGGRGVILVGSHLGAHLSAPHWIYRRGLPLRMLIQRPAHVSKLLNSHFDITDGPHPQPGFFLRRHLTPEEASKRIFRARSALRDGLIVYLKGDVPWVGANTRPGRLLGHDQTFQSLWADFAALFRAPVVSVFCTHLPGGRYSLTFDAPFTVTRGAEGAAVERYLARLETEILAHPADAVGHLLWPCYTEPRKPETEWSGTGRSTRQSSRSRHIA